jgi:hypothetical protein
MKRSAAIFGLALMLAFTACSSSDDEKKEEDLKAARENEVANVAAKDKYKPPAPICPQVAIIHELEYARDYGGEKPDTSQLVAAAKLVGLDGECEYQDNGIDITFKTSLAAKRGPRLGSDHADFPFFIAVVDPDQKILNKDQITASFRFKEGENITTQDEPLHVFIPLAKDKDQTGPNYQVLLGFQLNEQQLKDVRDQEDRELEAPTAPTAH